MKIDISIRKLQFDTVTGRFTVTVAAHEEIDMSGEDAIVGIGPRTDAVVFIEGTGLTHQEAVSVAVSKALRDPIFHKAAA